jgi:hypothetical protein
MSNVAVVGAPTPTTWGMRKIVEWFYSAEKVAREHAQAAWERGELWRCLCPSCCKVRDLPLMPVVDPIDDHTW